MLEEREDRAELWWIRQVAHPVELEEFVQGTCQAILHRNGHSIILCDDDDDDVLWSCVLKVTNTNQLWLVGF